MHRLIFLVHFRQLSNTGVNQSTGQHIVQNTVSYCSCFSTVNAHLLNQLQATSWPLHFTAYEMPPYLLPVSRNLVETYANRLLRQQPQSAMCHQQPTLVVSLPSKEFCFTICCPSCVGTQGWAREWSRSWSPKPCTSGFNLTSPPVSSLPHSSPGAMLLFSYARAEPSNIVPCCASCSGHPLCSTMGIWGCMASHASLPVPAHHMPHVTPM